VTTRYWREIHAEIDPAGHEKLVAYLSSTNEIGAIDPTTRTLIAIACSTAVIAPTSVRTHVRHALDAGISRDAVYQAISLGATSAGVPALQSALGVLDEFSEVIA
jgi:alkylhydroperoxidase/carboxymuconolactone decarboxylase family protein YurZ